MRYSIAAVIVVVALILGLGLAYGQTPALPAPSDLHPFDMKQCWPDSRGCQLATCVRQITPSGDIVICQSHGTFFP
jgi:hypothetical protein